MPTQYDDPPQPVLSNPGDKDLEMASPADLAATQAVSDPADHTKEYLTDVHTIPKNNLPLVFAGVSCAHAFGGQRAPAQREPVHGRHLRCRLFRRRRSRSIGGVSVANERLTCNLARSSS